MKNQEFLELIKTRRSCRKYADTPVTADELHAVVEAGTYAPTGHGSQDPVIVAVRDAELRSRLSAMNAAVMGTTSDPYYGAPVFLLVFASESNANALQDGSCVLENMMLAAHAVGLASCWINREIEMFATQEGKKLMREMGLPEGLKGIGALALGHPAAEPHPAKPRKQGWLIEL